MKVSRPRALYVASTVASLYLLTWAVASWMVRPALEQYMLDEWAAYVLQVHPDASASDVRSRARNDAARLGFRVTITALIPVFPGFVVAKSQVVVPTNSGDRRSEETQSLSVIAVYGFGARVVYSWPTS